MHILPGNGTMFTLIGLTIAAIGGTVYGVAVGAPIVPAVVIGLYAIGGGRYYAQHKKGEYCAYKSDNFFLWVGSPVTVPLHGLMLLTDARDRFRYRREAAKRKATDDAQG